MYPYSVSRLIAFMVALISVAPMVSPIVLLRDDRSMFDLIPSAGWSFFLAGGSLIVLWAVLVYRFVLLYLTLTYEVPRACTTAPKPWKVGAYSAIIDASRAMLSSSEQSKRVSFQGTPARMAFLSALVGLIGALAIDGVVELAKGQRIGAPVFLDTWQLILTAVVLFVLLSPVVETLFMAAILEPFKSRWGHSSVLPIASGLIWGGWHALVTHPMQFFSTTWLFWILSNLYLQTRRENSLMTTYLTTCAAHALNNILALLLILARQHLF